MGKSGEYQQYIHSSCDTQTVQGPCCWSNWRVWTPTKYVLNESMTPKSMRAKSVFRAEMLSRKCFSKRTVANTACALQLLSNFQVCISAWIGNEFAAYPSVSIHFTLERVFAWLARCMAWLTIKLVVQCILHCALSPRLHNILIKQCGQHFLFTWIFVQEWAH